jgi:hypothetical protein
MQGTPELRHQQKVADAFDLIGAWAAIIGMAAGVFGPWETALLSPSTSFGAFGTVSGFGYSYLDAGLILGCAIASAAILYRYRRGAGSAFPLIVLGVIACTVGAYAWKRINEDRLLGQADWGVVVATISAGALVLFALPLSEEIREALRHFGRR